MNLQKIVLNKYIYSIILFLITISCLFIFQKYPNITEHIYSTGIYPYISISLRKVLGWLPFSVGDILYTIIGIYSFYFLIKNFKNIWRKPIDFFGKIIRFIIIIFFLFHFLWGFNYHRIPLEKKLNLNTTYTESEIYKTTEKLIFRSNLLHSQLVKNDSLPVHFPMTTQRIYELTTDGYQILSQKFPFFTLNTSSLKSSIYSLALTYMGYSGYLNPFTGEAQVNNLPTGYQLPITAAHEVAHQLGYSAENEANFIGYLACLHHENLYFQYSANLFGLRYCLAEIRKIDSEKYEEFIKKIHSGILQNYKESANFWKQYQNPMESFFKASYDTFLKANNQKNGIQSYHYVTGMIINYEAM